MRKQVAIVGAHLPSLAGCPWDDREWILCGHPSGRQFYQRELDLYFDLHPRASWMRKPEYYAWLTTTPFPVYMQNVVPDIPSSRRFPAEWILSQFPSIRPYFTSQTAWMIAYAVLSGAQRVGLYGCNYSADSEYVIQRAGVEYMIGRAQERKVEIVLPEGCDLLSMPHGLYGYQSHHEDTGEPMDEYRYGPFIKKLVAKHQAECAKREELQALVEKIRKCNAERPPWAENGNIGKEITND